MMKKSLYFLCLLVGINLMIPSQHSQAAPIDLTARASEATWVNDQGISLPFPGSPTDSRGFARVLSDRIAGMPGTHRVLETHPRWAANGFIQGVYRLTMPAGVVFEATVGFMEGAVGTDGVTFEVLWAQWRNHNLQLTSLKRLNLSYGMTGWLYVDLTRFAGQEGALVLRVHAGASADRDWAVWLNPVIKEKPLDADQDGIPDAKERELLDKHSPFILYAKGERLRPSDAIWYIRHSELKPGADEDASNVISSDVLQADPARLLTANYRDLGSSDITRNPTRTGYCINIFNDFRSGQSWEEITRLRNVGVYGHVVPWRNFYLVSYWLFYPYNDPEYPLGPYGNHEGEWESVHLLIDPATGWLKKTFHLVHGKEIIFDFEVDGVSRHKIKTRVGEVLEFRGPNYNTSRLDVEDNLERACNNHVRFYPDPTTNEFTHIMVYVERSVHASFPTDAPWNYNVEIRGLPDWESHSHAGDGYTVLTRNIPNLGEVEHPLSEDARIILHYNGRWGAFRGWAADWIDSDTPPGPQFHWQWVWPKESWLSGLRRRIPNNAFTDGGSFFQTNPY